MADATDNATTPRPIAGNFRSEIDPISQLSPHDLEQERTSRTQKPKPHSLAGQRKDGTRPADITVGSLDPSSPHRNVSAAAAASRRRNSSPFNGTSPNRLGKSSPHQGLSPATSQIFERDVQESTTLAPELSPAIPTHIATEDHIPPVLEASSLAITDQYDPDEVEIVMHSAHQPAVTTISQSTHSDQHPSASASHSDLANATSIQPSSLPGGLSSEGFPTASAPAAIPRSSPPPGLHHESSQEERESNNAYAAVDPADPRRLSFISFADVVNAEHAEMAHSQSFSDATVLSQSSTAPSITGGNRSPSPIRSPFVSASPPNRTSLIASGGEASPVRGGAAGSFMSGGAPAGHPSGTHGELTIATMRETLQKTGSNDVPGHAGGGSGAGSQPMSATSAEDVNQAFAK